MCTFGLLLGCSISLERDQRQKEPTSILELDEDVGDVDAVLQRFEILKTEHGDRHPLVVDQARVVGYALLDSGHFSQSCQAFQFRLEALQESKGRDDLDTLLAQSELAEALRLSGKLKEAGEHLESIQPKLEIFLRPDDPRLVKIQISWINTLIGAGDFRRAQELAQKVVVVLESSLGSEAPETLSAKGSLASATFALGDHSGAKKLELEIHAELAKSLGPEHLETVRANSNLAVTLQVLGDYSGAKERFEEVFSTRRKVLGAEHPDTLAAQANLSVAVHASGDFRRANQIQKQLYPRMIEVLGAEHPTTMTIGANLALTSRDLGDFEFAVQLYESLIKSRQTVLGADHPSTLTTQANLAEALNALGDFELARRYQQDVFMARQRVLGSEHPDTLTSSVILADTLRKLGMLEDARLRHEDVLSKRVRILGSEHPDTIRARSQLATTLFELGDLALARQHQERVLSGSKTILGPEHPDTLAATSNLALTIKILGELEDALQLEEMVFEIRCRILGLDHPDTMVSESNLVNTFLALNRLVEAQDRQEKIYRSFSRSFGPDHPDTLIARATLANIYKKNGSIDRALAIEEDVLSARRRIFGPIHPQTLFAIHNLASTLAMKNRKPKAIQLLKEPVLAQQQRGLHIVPSTAFDAEYYWLLGRLLREEGDLEGAEAAFSWALDAIEVQAARFDFTEESQGEFYTAKSQAFYEAISLAVQRKSIPEAFGLLERFRTYSLVADRIRNNESLKNPFLEPRFRRALRMNGFKYDALTQELRDLYPKQEGGDDPAIQELIDRQLELRRERDLIIGRIVEELREDPSRPKPLQASHIQRILEDDAAILAFSIGNAESYGFVLTSDALQAFKIDSSDLFERSTRFLDLIVSSKTSFSPNDTEALQRSSEWFMANLFEPAKAQLEGKDRLLIMPDGPLQWLPFAALAKTSVDIGDGSYLAASKSIHVVQSGSIYQELQKRRGGFKEPRRGGPTWLGIGDPYYPAKVDTRTEPNRLIKAQAPGSAGSIKFSETQNLISRGFKYWSDLEKLKRLPQTEREIEAIASRFRAKSLTADIYLRNAATEDLIRNDLTGIRYIHIAGHAAALTSDPQAGIHASDSFIALSLLPRTTRMAAGLKHNGLLQTWEISNELMLNADLVVLSACETAIGEYRGGEGLLSLSRSFLQAGARSVLASLWLVDDLSTSELMIRFYDHLLSGKSKVESLRMAQMELASRPVEVTFSDGTSQIMDFMAPYHWAGFQLVGDWQ